MKRLLLGVCALALAGCAEPQTIYKTNQYHQNHAGNGYNEKTYAGYMLPKTGHDFWPDFATETVYRPHINSSEPVALNAIDSDRITLPVSSGGGWANGCSHNGLCVWQKAIFHPALARDATDKIAAGVISGTVSLARSGSKDMAIGATDHRVTQTYTLAVADMKPSAAPVLAYSGTVKIEGALYDLAVYIRPAQGIVSRAMITTQGSERVMSNMGNPMPFEEGGSLSSVMHGGGFTSTDSDLHDPVRPTRGGFGAIVQ